MLFIDFIAVIINQSVPNDKKLNLLPTLEMADICDPNINPWSSVSPLQPTSNSHHLLLNPKSIYFRLRWQLRP